MWVKTIKQKQWIAGLSLAGAIFSGTLASASEVDQFTLPPGEPVTLTDSTAILDAEVNRLLTVAVDNANSRIMQTHAKTGTRWVAPGCDETRLYDALAAQLARSVIGQMETYAEQEPQISRRKVALENSIYREFYWQASPTLVWSERIAAVIKVNGVEFGADKLGHFFTEGHTYFVLTDHLRKNIESGLLFGEWTESVYYGAQTTGVFSFADLTANFQGLRFWNRIRGQQADPLTEQIPQPYIQCKQAHWELTGAFRWQDYVDTAWSEAINCSALRSDDLLQRIKKQNLLCRPARLPTDKYGRWASRLLNQEGHISLPPELQPEVILEKRVALNDVQVSQETVNYVAELRARLEAWRMAAAAALKDKTGLGNEVGH